MLQFAGMSRKRVVVAGLGDVGILTAIRLSRYADVVGISVKPGLVSGQELGVRLARPGDWARDYWVPFDRYRRLDRVRIIQATLTGLDLTGHTVSGQSDDRTTFSEEYDALVISTGVSNGFWRRPTVQSAAEIAADLGAAHDRMAEAESVIVVGGGATRGGARDGGAGPRAFRPGRVDAHGFLPLPRAARRDRVCGAPGIAFERGRTCARPHPLRVKPQFPDLGANQDRAPSARGRAG